MDQTAAHTKPRHPHKYRADFDGNPPRDDTQTAHMSAEITFQEKALATWRWAWGYHPIWTIVAIVVAFWIISSMFSAMFAPHPPAYQPYQPYQTNP